MHYILVIELEETGLTSTKIQGLSSQDVVTLETDLAGLKLTFNKGDNFIEVEGQGVQVLNLLASSNYDYRVISQSMVIEKTTIGRRTIQIQKTVWTLNKNE